MFRALLALLLLSSAAYAHDTGRQCSNSYCGMCTRLHLIHGHDMDPDDVTRAQDWTKFNDRTRLHGDLHAPPTFVPTPLVVVKAMVALADPSKEDLVYDVGCGDGRMLIEAATRYGCQGVGIEIDPKTARLAARTIEEAKATGIRIVEGDARKYKLDQADIIFIYLDTELMEDLKGELVKARMVVSYSHPVPGVRNEKVLVNGKYPVYIYRNPAYPTWW